MKTESKTKSWRFAQLICKKINNWHGGFKTTETKLIDMAVGKEVYPNGV